MEASRADVVRKPRISTAGTLSLLTAGVVFVVLATAIGVTWLTLRRSAVEASQDRLNRGVRQLVTVAETSVRQLQPRYRALARDPAIRRLLHASDQQSAAADSSVLSVLRKLQTRADSGMPVELWDAAARRLAFVGNDVPHTIGLQIRSESGLTAPPMRAGLDSLVLRDSLQLGSLYVSGGRSHFWLVMPVVESGRAIGFIAQQRRLSASSQVEQTIRELSGTSVSGYYRNADGSGWTTLAGVPTNPPSTSADSTVRTRPGLGPIIYAEGQITGTPLWLVMEIPHRAILARTSATVRQLAVFGVALTIIGALLAGMFGRRVTRPLVRLTSAAESMARGDFTARVSTSGSHEVARLASSFNNMAAQVGDSRSVLERQESELRALANAIPQLSWMADAAGTVFWFNDRWYEYTGFSKNEPPDAQWMQAHSGEVQSQILQCWHASVQSGEPFEMEVQLRRADGSWRWFLTRIVPARDRNERISRWFGTATDIQTLREAREAAEAGSRAKSDFLAAMSHELRTPLNAIGGYTELLEMGLRGPLTDEQRRDLTRIRLSQQHLLGLIGAVLDLSRIESGRVTYDMMTIAVEPFLAGLEALVLPQVTAKHQTLECHVADRESTVIADPEKLRQILLNLLSNAIRYSPPGGKITLGADTADGDAVEIFVRDTGLGIPAGRQKAIFEPFVQLDRSLTRTTEGVGLGLAISRDLAHGMNGELAVVSSPGEGACFALSLPRGTRSDVTLPARTFESPIASPVADQRD